MKQDLKVKIRTVSNEDKERNFSYFNPAVSNEAAQSIATALVDLSTNTYIGAERITTTDVLEEYPFDPTPPTPSGLQNPNLRIENNRLNWDGNGECNYYYSDGETLTSAQAWKNTDTEEITVKVVFVLTSDGTYAKDWLVINEE